MKNLFYSKFAYFAGGPAEGSDAASKAVEKLPQAEKERALKNLETRSILLKGHLQSLRLDNEVEWAFSVQMGERDMGHALSGLSYFKKQMKAKINRAKTRAELNVHIMELNQWFFNKGIVWRKKLGKALTLKPSLKEDAGISNAKAKFLNTFQAKLAKLDGQIKLGSYDNRTKHWLEQINADPKQLKRNTKILHDYAALIKATLDTVRTRQELKALKDKTDYWFRYNPKRYVRGGATL